MEEVNTIPQSTHYSTIHALFTLFHLPCTNYWLVPSFVGASFGNWNFLKMELWLKDTVQEKDLVRELIEIILYEKVGTQRTDERVIDVEIMNLRCVAIW